MAARSGMTNILLRLRAMTETADGDYSVDGTSYWTDDQLQDLLDQYADRFYVKPLQPEAEYVSGSTIWKDYPTGYEALEDVASGAPYWSLTDSSGTEVATTDYELDQWGGVIRFDNNTSGALYYLTGRAYPLAKVAAKVWRMKMSHAWTAYDFTTEGQTFNRSQMFDHCHEMAKLYESQSGIQTSMFVRSDLQ